MRAIVQDAYGSADTLQFGELPRPAPSPGEILVRVRAAAVTQGDRHLMTGLPYLIRLTGFGLRRPKQRVPGQYLAGVVEAVGEGVEELHVGDRVWGCGTGTYAELATAREDSVVSLPETLTFEQAAALPHGGLTALQALRDAGRLRPDQRVLVVGASGAVGTMAVQLAKSMGAEVTGVCGPAKLERVASLGADRVLDHTRDDFAAERERYDLILDTVRTSSNADTRRALAPDGRVVMVSGGPGTWLGGMGRSLFAALTSIGRSKKFAPMIAEPRRADLLRLNEEVVAGRLRPVLRGSFPFDRIHDAVRHLESGNGCGTIVLTIDDEASGRNASRTGS